MPPCKVALDIMSGDESPRSRIRAACRALERFPFLELVLVGDTALIESYLGDAGNDRCQRFSIVHTESTVSMHDRPSQALRNKKHSSMWKALELVAQGEAGACVSSGNTGALMAMGRFILTTFSGVDRPAIAARVPGKKKGALLLDLGANIGCTPDHLYQFAVMGAQLAASVDGIQCPRVALLNVGTEDVKGTESIRLAHQLLSDSSRINYVGYIEGHDIFNSRADVVVCDGFAGNVALKTGEGVASLVASMMREIFQRNLFNRLAYLLLSPVFKEFMDRVDPDLHNGASFLGLRGTVIKSHGSADEKGFYRAICQAVREVESDAPARIAAEVERILV